MLMRLSILLNNKQKKNKQIYIYGIYSRGTVFGI